MLGASNIKDFLIKVTLGLDDKNFTTKMQTVGKSMTSFGTKATLGITLPIIGAGLALAKLGIDAGETMSKVNTVFAENTEEIQKWSKQSVVSLMLTSLEAQNYAATMANIGMGMGMNRNEATALSKQYIELAADMSSFNNIPIAETVRAVTGAMTGEYEMLKRLGVVILDADLKVHALNMGYKESYKDLDRAIQQQIKYNLMVKRAGVQLGDLERTQGDAANQLKAFQTIIKGTAEDIGVALLPLINELIKDYLPTLIEQVKSLAKNIGDMSKEELEAKIRMAGIIAAAPALILILGTLITHITTIAIALPKIWSSIVLIKEAIIGFSAETFLLVMMSDIAIGLGVIGGALWTIYDYINLIKKAKKREQTTADFWERIGLEGDIDIPARPSVFGAAGDDISPKERDAILARIELMKELKRQREELYDYPQTAKVFFSEKEAQEAAEAAKIAATGVKALDIEIAKLNKQLTLLGDPKYRERLKTLDELKLKINNILNPAKAANKEFVGWFKAIENYIGSKNMDALQLGITHLTKSLWELVEAEKAQFEEWEKAFAAPAISEKGMMFRETAMEMFQKAGWLPSPENIENYLETIARFGQEAAEEIFAAFKGQVIDDWEAIIDVLSEDMQDMLADLPGFTDTGDFGVKPEKDGGVGKEAKDVYGKLNDVFLESIQSLTKSIQTGDIAGALQNTFNMLGNVISEQVTKMIVQANLGGASGTAETMGGQVLGALGGGLVGVGISLLGGLFGGKSRGAEPQTPSYVHVVNWDDFYQLGFSLPQSFLYSGRANNFGVDPHGRALSVSYEGWQTGQHFSP